MRAANWRQLTGWPLFLVAFVLFAGGLFNDPPWKGLRTAPKVQFGSEPVRVAASLVRHGAFADPFAAAPTGPTAHVSPLFAVLQAAVLKLCGFGWAGWLALRAMAVIALSLQYALLPGLARLLGFSPWTGVAAALFGLLSKPGKEDFWETNLAGLAILALTAAMHKLQSGTASPPARRAWTAGGLAGLATLLQPVIAPVYFAWVFLTARRSAPLWIAPVLVCTPWIVRNQIVLGAPLTIRDNLGIELYVSYNDCAPYGVRQSMDMNCIGRLHPFLAHTEAADVAALGEYRYNQDRMRRAFSWMAQHPRSAVALAGQRFWYFWFPSDGGWRAYPQQRKRMLALHAMTLASFAGLWIAFRRRIPSVKLLTLWLALFPPVYYVVQFEARYRYPILWITWLLAAFAIEAALQAWRRTRAHS